MSDPVHVATGISELIYEATKPSPSLEAETFDDDLVNAWATGLADDDGLWGNNALAMNRVVNYNFHPCGLLIFTEIWSLKNILNLSCPKKNCHAFYPIQKRLCLLSISDQYHDLVFDRSMSFFLALVLMLLTLRMRIFLPDLRMMICGQKLF